MDTRDDHHEVVHTQHDKMAEERWEAHLGQHGLEKELSEQRWIAHREQHEVLARALSEYKRDSNEWRGSLADLRGNFATRIELDALDARIDTEREERRDQQNLRVGNQRGISQTVGVALAAVGVLATVLSIVAILAGLLR